MLIIVLNNNNIFCLFSKQNNAYTFLWPVTKKLQKISVYTIHLFSIFLITAVMVITAEIPLVPSGFHTGVFGIVITILVVNIYLTDVFIFLSLFS